MKFLLLISALLFSADSFAEQPAGLDSARANFNSLETVGIVEADKALNDGNYTGRNKNVRKEVLDNAYSTSGSRTRSISLSTSKTATAFEALESSSGEFIQKVEDDRLRFSEKQLDKYEEIKENLKTTYNKSTQIKVENLGKEQDPTVQNAFKCENIENCKSNSSADPHFVKECDGKLLHWTGQNWQCLDTFEKPESANCKSHQYAQAVNGGTACIDYIYDWAKTGLEACGSNGKAKEIYRCMQKKGVNDAGTVVSESIELTKCKIDKPEGYENCGKWSSIQCTSCTNSGFHDRWYTVRSTCLPSGAVCQGEAPTLRCVCKREKHGSDRKRDREKRNDPHRN